MTLEEANVKIQEVLNKVDKRPECLRYGQAVYNEFYKELKHYNLSTFENKEVDCYYRDDKVPEFLTSLQTELIYG